MTGQYNNVDQIDQLILNSKEKISYIFLCQGCSKGLVSDVLAHILCLCIGLCDH